MKSSAIPPGWLGSGVKPSGRAGQGLGHGVTEVLVGRIQQFRGLFLRQHIDRYPEVSLAAADTDLVMR
jgi:hypothetical protein